MLFDTAFAHLTGGGGKLLDIKRLSAFKIFFRPVFGGASLAVASLEATHSDLSCAGFFCVSIGANQNSIGTPGTLRGTNRTLRDANGSFRGTNGILRGATGSSRGTPKLLRGTPETLRDSYRNFISIL
jgi:hypothetical protein